MSEHVVITVKASVMMYDDGAKKWHYCPPASDSSKATLPESQNSAGHLPIQPGSNVAKVQIYRHTAHNTYRIVARKCADQEVVLNSHVHKNLKYNKATPTFHQWRDVKQVYGLNFASAQEATSFAEVMINAVDHLNINSTEPLTNGHLPNGNLAAPVMNGISASHQQPPLPNNINNNTLNDINICSEIYGMRNNTTIGNRPMGYDSSNPNYYAAHPSNGNNAAQRTTSQLMDRSSDQPYGTLANAQQHYRNQSTGALPNGSHPSNLVHPSSQLPQMEPCKGGYSMPHRNSEAFNPNHQSPSKRVQSYQLPPQNYSQHEIMADERRNNNNQINNYAKNNLSDTSYTGNNDYRSGGNSRSTDVISHNLSQQSSSTALVAYYHEPIYGSQMMTTSSSTLLNYHESSILPNGAPTNYNASGSSTNNTLIASNPENYQLSPPSTVQYYQQSPKQGGTLDQENPHINNHTANPIYNNQDIYSHINNNNSNNNNNVYGVLSNMQQTNFPYGGQHQSNRNSEMLGNDMGCDYNNHSTNHNNVPIYQTIQSTENQLYYASNTNKIGHICGDNKSALIPTGFSSQTPPSSHITHLQQSPPSKPFLNSSSNCVSQNIPSFDSNQQSFVNEYGIVQSKPNFTSPPKNACNVYSHQPPAPPPLPKLGNLSTALANVKLKKTSPKSTKSTDENNNIIKNTTLKSLKNNLNPVQVEPKSQMMQEMIATLAKRKQRLNGVGVGDISKTIGNSRESALADSKGSPKSSSANQNPSMPIANEKSVKASPPTESKRIVVAPSTEGNGNLSTIPKSNGISSSGNGYYNNSNNSSNKMLGAAAGTVNSITSILSSASSSSFSSLHSGESASNLLLPHPNQNGSTIPGTLPATAPNPTSSKNGSSALLLNSITNGMGNLLLNGGGPVNGNGSNNAIVGSITERGGTKLFGGKGGGTGSHHSSSSARSSDLSSMFAPEQFEQSLQHQQQPLGNTPYPHQNDNGSNTLTSNPTSSPQAASILNSEASTLNSTKQMPVGCITNRATDNTCPHITITPDLLDTLKRDLITEMRREINVMKNELLLALKSNSDKN